MVMPAGPVSFNVLTAALAVRAKGVAPVKLMLLVGCKSEMALAEVMLV